MNKKLPNVFVNKIDKKIRNNEEVYYSDKEEKKEEVMGVNIREKIENMYRDVPFLYKKKVLIILHEQKIETKVISYNQNYLITIDNQRFLLDDIEDMEFIE